MTAIPAQLGAFFPQLFDFNQIEQNLVSNQAIARLILACALGAIIGVEREWLRRAAGIRTNMLICMGCAFFTLLSPILAGDTGNNKGQVAANIVQGIGFLGAGLIVHTRSRVSGLASAASVFVVASIGMACGAGLFLPAVIATLIVLVAVMGLGFLERRVNLKVFPMLYETRGSDQALMLASILDAMDKEHNHFGAYDRDAVGPVQRVSFSLTATKSQHERLQSLLLKQPGIEVLKAFPDVEGD